MQQVTNEELTRWMDGARIGPRGLADRLGANGHDLSPQRISQWRNGDPISKDWQVRILQVMSDTAREDMRRSADVLAPPRLHGDEEVTA